VNAATAAWLGFGLTIAAQNCNSLNMVSSSKNQDLKISAITEYKCDIILLSDTRLNKRDHNVADKLRLMYTMHHNSSKNSRGVAILFNNSLDYEVLETVTDNDENVLLIRARICNKEIGIGAVYGPNDNECGNFFGTITDTVRRWNGIPCILGGDWNATMCSDDVTVNPDVMFMRSIPSRFRSERIAELCEDLDLSDPFRTLHPEDREFTYYPSGTQRKNRSRIDFFLMSSCLYQTVDSCTIAQSFCRKNFDHKPIFLSLKKRRGKGRACIYAATADNPLANDVVKYSVYRTVLETRSYDHGIITNNILHAEEEKLSRIMDLINRICFLQGTLASTVVDQTLVDELEIAVADLPVAWNRMASLQYLESFERQVKADEYFEKLITNVRADLLNFQKHLKTVESAERKEWIRELIYLKKTNYEVHFDRIAELENRLNNASEKHILDRLSNYVKSDVLNSEKMTPRFLKIAEKNTESNLSSICKPDGTPFQDNIVRGEYIANFYECLYKNPHNMPLNFDNCVENFLGDLVNHPAIVDKKLSDEERTRLEADFAAEELDAAMDTCNLRSAPGMDGFSNKVIKKFWQFFRKPLLEYANECVRNGKLTETFKTALIKLIPKKGDVTQIKNWRPISLLSCFYKIISKAVNNRLELVIDKLTSIDQKAYSKQRYIQEALISTVNTIRHCEVNNIKGAILSIDQKKAFDSVYHGYMDSVYIFFGFGPRFRKLLKTIGTGRKARVILEGGKHSRDFDLERGFAQGDGPSPRLYNVGEQILLFRLEYDPEIAGIYLSFIIPRTVINNEVTYPRIEAAEAAGFTVDTELKHHNRRIPAFADDANGGFDRSARNLAYIKNILTDFGIMCGLETNVEKTTLMPIGCLDEPVGQDVIDLGFEIVNEIKCLGMMIDNRAANLSRHFDGTIRKIQQLIGSWDRYNLSLMGRICIAKTMLISQIGYIGCIVSPTPDQRTSLQNLIDGYVTKGIVIAKDRLYDHPKVGGLGLINLEHYISALQCSWIRRCFTVINDSWRWRIAEGCNFNFEDPLTYTPDPELYPIEHNIMTSFTKFRSKFFGCNENFLHAKIVNNPMFLRGIPGRAQEPGIVDPSFFGHQFFEMHKERLLDMKMNNLIANGAMINFQDLIRTTGVPFTQVIFFRLIPVCNYAIVKYANRENSNGTSVNLSGYICRVKKGSKRFRRILNQKNPDPKIENLRVVQTFFRFLTTEVPDPVAVGKLHCIWTWQFLSNRIRFFAFQYYNNSLGTKTRIAARYRNGGIILDQRCTFCVKAGSLVPMREDFIHVFYDCPHIRSLCDRAYDIYFKHRLDDTKKRLCYMTGTVDTYQKNDGFFYMLTSLLINYTVWQSKLRVMIPGIATLTNEVDYLFYMVCFTSKKIENMAIISNCPICRRWRAGQYGRG
jgi:exonuclease III